MGKKLSLEFIKRSFEKENYLCLENEYKNAHQKLKYICPNRHRHETSWNKWQQGKRCPYCAGNARKTMPEIKKSFDREGYKLLTREYINNRTKLDYVCPEGHKHSIEWAAWQAGNRCPFCNGNAKLTINLVNKIFNSEGFVVLSKEYKNNKTKLDYICKKGHQHKMSVADFKKGTRCPYCSGKAKKTISFIKDVFALERYDLLSTKYKNAHSKLTFICPRGHKVVLSWHSWQSGRRCPTCAGKRLDTTSIFDFLSSENYILTSNYNGGHGYISYICPNGHKNRMRWHNWNSGKRCPKCTNQQSKNELELLAFLHKHFDNIIERDRSIISPYELDIVLPDQKTAIEYCGLYWHSELAGKDKNYHLKKLDLCEKAGYKLITIFEDEFIKNKNIVFSRIINILGINQSKKVYARNCLIKEISTVEAKNFCIKNHLQGYVGSNIKLGAFYNNKLVSVMTFSKPNISKGHKKYSYFVWELSRFCSDRNIRVIGIASKLLKYFKKNYEWYKIFSYADRRWSNGNLYKRLGFIFVGATGPNYWYFKDINRIHRFALRKNVKDSKNKTEWQIRQSQGWNRIWDCGNLKFETGGLKNYGRTTQWSS